METGAYHLHENSLLALFFLDYYGKTKPKILQNPVSEPGYIEPILEGSNRGCQGGGGYNGYFCSAPPNIGSNCMKVQERPSRFTVAM
jgi:hypothetical protein